MSKEQPAEHWRSELARVLKAAPDLPWPNLINWAEEAEHFAAKACTKSGRARLAGLEDQVTKLEAAVTRLTADLKAAREAKLAEAQPRLKAVEKLAAAWQEEAERARKDAAGPADMADIAEMRIWDALERPLAEAEVVEHIQILRSARHLAVQAIEIATSILADAKKRVRDLHSPIEHMRQTWCAECSTRRSTGPRTDEWVSYVPHPCPTLNAIENKEPTS